MGMRKSDAIAHFTTQQKLADHLGLAQSTVAGWGPVVPLDWAFVLEKTTELKVDYALYPKLPASLFQASQGPQ